MNNAIFWNIIEKEVSRQNTTFEWLYRKTKISKGTFSSWKSRKIIPRADVVLRIAEALGVSVEYLLTGMSTIKYAENQSIQELVENVSVFDQNDFEAVRAMVKIMAQRYKKPQRM
jgi:transcriptional regulator with XRE-family HTH domain